MPVKYYNCSWDICCKSTSYGTYKNGAEIYKDRTGYFIVHYNPQNEKFYKKYLKNFTPNPDLIAHFKIPKRKCTKKQKEAAKKKTRKH